MIDNRFEDNWGPAAYGLLLKEIKDSRIEGNVLRAEHGRPLRRGRRPDG